MRHLLVTCLIVSFASHAVLANDDSESRALEMDEIYHDSKELKIDKVAQRALVCEYIKVDKKYALKIFDYEMIERNDYNDGDLKKLYIAQFDRKNKYFKKEYGLYERKKNSANSSRNWLYAARLMQKENGTYINTGDINDELDSVFQIRGKNSLGKVIIRHIVEPMFYIGSSKVVGYFICNPEDY